MKKIKKDNKKGGWVKNLEYQNNHLRFVNGSEKRGLKFIFLSVFLEDILDEVSGLTAESPDESLDEEPLLSPRDHQEDRSFTAASQKVDEDLLPHTFRQISHPEPDIGRLAHATDF